MTITTLQASGVSKSFPDGKGRRQIMQDASIDVFSGEVVGVVGPSGSGKSTLLSMLGGLLRPDSGEILIANQQLDYDNTKEVAHIRQKHIGWISQAYDLVVSDSIEDNVSLPLVLDKPRPKKDVRNRAVEEALNIAGLNIKKWRSVSTLSVGERQRVAIARALVRVPSLLIADEPTAALDHETGAHIVDTLRTIAASGTAVLVATHDPLVIDSCHRIYRFDGSRVIEDTH